MGARLGQHFLRDEAVLRDVLDAARIRPKERVLEVGPGPGTLTMPLCNATGPDGLVVAIEADPALARALTPRTNLRVVEGDAVQVDLEALGRFDAIVANLPYLISGPITAAFLELLGNPETRWGRAILMYQREFAERLLAKPGTGDYGRLTVHTQRACAVTKVRDVPPGCFDPPPKVDSMVIRLVPHAAEPFKVHNERLWRAVVDGPFQNRRKQLRNTLPGAIAGLGIDRESALAALERLGLSSKRPEELAPATFAALCDAIEGR